MIIHRHVFGDLFSLLLLQSLSMTMRLSIEIKLKKLLSFFTKMLWHLPSAGYKNAASYDFILGFHLI